MKKEFSTPIIEVININEEDVIKTSGFVPFDEIPGEGD